MFGRKTDTVEAPPETGRFHVETIQSSFAHNATKHVERVSEALNAGDARGWRLEDVNTSPIASTVNLVTLLVWDTEPAG